MELNDPKPDRRKDAVKKVIAAMTVGKDVSMLFPDVLKCMFQVTTMVWIYSLTNCDLDRYAN